MDGMIKAFRKLHKFQDGFSGAASCLEQMIGRPICISNCGLCCQHNTPMCMTIEAMNAISILVGDSRYKKIISTAEGWLLERHKEAPSYNGMLSGCFVNSEIRDQIEAIRVLPCPFLAENKECVLHDARPLVCQAYGVTRAGSGFCPRPPGKGETLTQLMYIKSPELHADLHNFKEHYQKEHPEWVIFGFLPAVIYRAAKEKEFRQLIADNRIATAKLIGTHIDTTLMWQAQDEAVQSGVVSDLVAAMN